MNHAEQCRLLARYNSWQNRSLVAAASALDHEARWLDRGAFFGSIARTFNHLYRDDALWLAGFAGDERPEDHVPFLLNEPSDWEAFRGLRAQRDTEIADWAGRLTPADLKATCSFIPEAGTLG